MPVKKKKLTGKKVAKNRKYDPAWKEVIKVLFKDFLEFFFPDIYHSIDFEKKPVFIDKELNDIDSKGAQGDRIADVLVKVHLKDGSAKYICIVIHIEVQSQPRQNFMDRMFIYYYRAFDQEMKAKTPVISLAILADDNPKYRPDVYSFSLFGFELRMKIPIVKILDYKSKKELKKRLEISTNPMSMVVKAQLKSHEANVSDDEKKFEVTKELIRQCYQNKYSKDTIRLMMRFFELVIRLPETFEERIKEVVVKIEEETKMEYVPFIERAARNEGIKIGMKRGRERGLERGLEQGMEKNSKETAKRMLEDGLPPETISKYTGLSIEEIKKLTPTSH